jgi:sorbitol-specific phosphotransferase system component IIBC
VPPFDSLIFPKIIITEGKTKTDRYVLERKGTKDRKKKKDQKGQEKKEKKKQIISVISRRMGSIAVLRTHPVHFL